MGELKNYQSQVNAYRFENERLDKQIQDIKSMWFNSKREGKLGVIKEMNEEDGMGIGGEMGGVV